MSPMLELAKDADYDALAAFIIFTAAISAKIWMNRRRKTHVLRRVDDSHIAA